MTLGALLGAVATGDRQALRTIYERQSGRLFGIAIAILRDRRRRRRRVQDAFLRISERAGQFEPSSGDAAAWLAGSSATRPRRRPQRGRESRRRPRPGRHPVRPTPGAVAADEGRRLRDCLAGWRRSTARASCWPSCMACRTPRSRPAGPPFGTVKSWIRRGLLVCGSAWHEPTDPASGTRWPANTCWARWRRRRRQRSSGAAEQPRAGEDMEAWEARLAPLAALARRKPRRRSSCGTASRPRCRRRRSRRASRRAPAGPP